MRSFHCASARPSRGFTLIELLIVIAIISILAMIAVPNFLEAQTRSKNARALADMRTLKTALEAYYVDYNQYPMDWDDQHIIDGSPAPAFPLNDQMSFSVLTTPVAYITSIMYMPYKFNDVQGSGPRFKPNNVYCYFGPSSTNPMRFSKYPGGANIPGGYGIFYVVQCPGPDMLQDFGQNWDEKFGADLAQRTAIGVSFIYDPTNGTVSKGDILMTGKGFCY